MQAAGLLERGDLVDQELAAAEAERNGSTSPIREADAIGVARTLGIDIADTGVCKRSTCTGERASLGLEREEDAPLVAAYENGLDDQLDSSTGHTADQVAGQSVHASDLETCTRFQRELEIVCEFGDQGVEV